jgi:hypothetical protein
MNTYISPFKINHLCTGQTYFNLTTQSCGICTPNCAQCLNATTCSQCAANYQLSNGTCQPCGPNTVYNATTFQCVDITTLCSGDQFYSVPLTTCVQCQPNCVQCASTTACQTCASNFMVVNGSCQACWIGSG